MTTEKTDSAARGVNEWRTDAVRDRCFAAAETKLGCAPLAAIVDAVLAALPPLVLASHHDKAREDWLRSSAEDRQTIDKLHEQLGRLSRQATAAAQDCNVEIERLRADLQRNSEAYCALRTAIGGGRGLNSLQIAKDVIAERDTLRARVAELEREVDAAWKATGAHPHFRERGTQLSTVVERMANARPQPSVPNAGEALTEPEIVVLLRTLKDGGTGRSIYAEDARPILAYIDALKSRPSPSPSAEAELTDEQVDNLVGDLPCQESSREHWRACVRRMIAHLDTLRPQPARLRMPTVEEAHDAIEAAANAGSEAYASGPFGLSEQEFRARCDQAQHRVLVAFLRTLGAEIVESEPTHKESLSVAAPFDPKRPDTWTPAQVAAFNAFDRRTAPAPAREPEPDYWTRLGHQYAIATLVAKQVDVFTEALEDGEDFAAAAEARRRVEGEEAGK